MLGREVNNPATLRFKPPQGKDYKIRGGGSHAYVAGLEKTLPEAHEVAQEKVRAAKKSIKRDYDLHMRTKKYKFGDLVYWRRNVGNNVQSVWFGLGIVTLIKSDTVYVIRTRRNLKLIHQDN